MSREVWLSPSKVQTFDDCRRKYWLTYEVKVSTTATSSNLVFGSCYDEAFNTFITSTVIGGQPFDCGDLFAAKFEAETNAKEIAYNKTMHKDDLMAIGIKMARQIPEAWNAAGFEPLFDKDGAPVLQREIVLDLGNGVKMRMKLDLGVVTREGKIAIIDNKTSSKSTDPDVLDMLEQVVDYQIGVDTIAAEHDWGQVDQIGFWEGVKKKDPVINAPVLRERASDLEVADRLRKLQWVAEDIRSGRFPKSPRAAYNTPCTMCDARKICASLGRDRDDFVIGRPDVR